MSDTDIARQLQRLSQRIGQGEVSERPLSSNGTWSPTLVGAVTAGTFTYAATTAGNYTRLGNTVLIRGRINITTVTVAPTGNLSIRGLPFTSATVTSGTAGVLSFVYWATVGLGGGAATYLAGWIQNAATQADLIISSNAGGGAVFLTGAIAGIANGSDMSFVGQYQVA